VATAGVIDILLRAQTGAFEKGMRRATVTIQGFSSSVVGIAGKIAGLGAALTGVAGVAGFGFLIKQQAEVIDQMSKLADRAGVSTEFLSGLARVADLAGVSNEMLTRGLDRMNRSMGEAMLGTGSAKDAFKLLGLSLEELVQMGTDKAFLRIADAIAGLDNAQLQAAISADIFGRTGQRLFSLIAEGSEGILEAQKRAEAMGLTFDRVAGAEVEAMNDAIRDLRYLMEGLGRIIAQVVAPVISVLTNRFIDWRVETKFGVDEVRNAFRGLAAALLRIIDVIDLARAVWTVFQSAVLSGAEIIARGMADILQITNEAIDAYVPFAGRIDALTDSVNFLRVASKEFGKDAAKAMEQGLDAYDKFAKGARSGDLLKGFDDIIRASREAAKKLTEDAIGVTSLEDALSRVRKPDKMLNIGTGQERNLGRDAFFSGQRFITQRVEDPQLKQTNALLARIDHNTSRNNGGGLSRYA
jgi:hypothetical protein